MDNLFLETFFFFVPNRLVWDNWQKFNGEQDNPGDSTDYTIPIIQNSGPIAETNLDYLGIPIYPGTGDGIDINALPLRGIHLIWNEWFRDQNLQNSLSVPTDDGPDPVSGYNNLMTRGKRHDYFTSCLPWPQKNQNPVTVPLGDRAPVYTDVAANNRTRILANDRSTPLGLRKQSASDWTEASTDGSDPANLYADLEAATGFTINELRQSFQIQKLYERDARGGTRYTEIVRSHFGVTSPDARLQRPEFLGGGSSLINVNPVANTAEGTGAVGDLGAFGTVTARGHGFVKSFTEHGYVLGFANVRADLTYQQGLHKMWSRRTRLDFYWPALSHLGEQAVLNKEIYTAFDSNTDRGVFGYQEKDAEYRYGVSMITGKMRSSHPESLDVWHLSQDFADTPVLGDTFIIDKPPLERVLAVPTEPHILLDAYFKVRCARPMPLYGVPGLIDHF